MDPAEEMVGCCSTVPIIMCHLVSEKERIRKPIAVEWKGNS